jgi:endonuclease G
LPGSSGSPVFNDQWEVIALHHWGEPTIMTTPDGKELRKDVNEGIRISAIVRALTTLRDKNNNHQIKDLLDEALDSKSRRPSFIRINGEQKPIPISSNNDLKQGEHYSPPPTIGSDGSVSWTIPINISVRLGNGKLAKNIEQPPNASKSPSELSPITIERESIKIDADYENRVGYNPDFLSKHVDLPILSANQKKLAAKKLVLSDSDDPYELRYHHFSIVLNKERRMALYTAVNIDGSKWVEIDRKTGEPSESAESGEIWFNDPRIEPLAQCDQKLYEKQKPHIFDRGHLVRRQDPCWGTKNRAVKANADTFHFTNCTPQQFQFNQRSKYWQGIENYILDNAKAEGDKVSVFTGPVFGEDDEQFRYVRLPKQFWKILVRVDKGKLLATALLADQSELISHLPESFSDLSQVAQYHTSVKEIERLTGLDFGSLKDHDTYPQGGEEAIVTRRSIITSFHTIILNT